MNGEPPTTNWAGTVAYRARRVHRPGSLDELRRLVAASRHIRALGTGHTFNTITDTDADLVRLDALPRRFELDPQRRTVTVSAGLRYADVGAELHRAGWALGNLASLPHIDIAGAVATGTHGSGVANPSLSTAVCGLSVVGPDGGLSDYTTQDRSWPGRVVHLGALGIVTALTLALEPTFDVAQEVRVGLTLDDVLADADAVLAAAYSVSVFTDWTGPARVWLKDRTDRPGPGWRGGRAAVRAEHPIAGLPTDACTEQLGRPGPWFDRLPHFRADHTPSAGAEIQSEYLLPRAALGRAAAALREIGPQLAGHLYVSEIRTVAADDQWLSPAGGRDSVAIHFTWRADPDPVAAAIAEVEARLRPLGARTHWGKLAAAGPGDWLATYPQAADFQALVRASDPDGTFGNDFVRHLLAQPREADG